MLYRKQRLCYHKQTSRKEGNMPSELLTKYPLPPSSEALESPRSYSDKEERQITDLAPLANTLATNPEVLKWLQDMKWLTMGDSDPRARYTGNHPLIKREINGQEYVYSGKIREPANLSIAPYLS